MTDGEPAFGFRDLLGFTIDTGDGDTGDGDTGDGEKGDGAATARLVCDGRHLNPHGTVHGAVPFALIDTAMGAAAMSVLDDSSMCASIEIQIRFLEPVFAGELAATVEVVKAGRRIIHLQGDVRDHDGRRVATATGSFAVIPRSQA